jgi:predicted RNA binding protein YcfA (HicA-like mRNA interferase family)
LPKQPVVSGETLFKFLFRFGYVAVRQKGSHLIIKKETVTGMHTTEIPMHDELDSGTLNGILTRVAQRNDADKSALIEGLRAFK